MSSQKTGTAFGVAIQPEACSTHTHTHTHTHTQWEPQTRTEQEKRERKLQGNCRAALDVFRSVGRQRQSAVLDSGFSTDTGHSCPLTCSTLWAALINRPRKTLVEEFVLMTAHTHAVVNKQTSTTPSPDVNSSSFGHQTRQSMSNASRRLSAGSRRTAAGRKSPSPAHTHTHTIANKRAQRCSECQIPRQLDRQTRNMFDANRRLSAVQDTASNILKP